jgi:hypothetical protein
MSGTFYDGELAELSNSFAAAMSANIDLLKLAIASTAESSIIGVGSGGSFTVASLLCNLHDRTRAECHDLRRLLKSFATPHSLLPVLSS